MGRSGPFCMPIYLNGSLQYFADVRAANNSLAAFFQKFDASINQQIADAAPSEPPRIADSAPGSKPPQDSGARSSEAA